MYLLFEIKSLSILQFLIWLIAFDGIVFLFILPSADRTKSTFQLKIPADEIIVCFDVPAIKIFTDVTF